jgi:hypothetical protein
MLAVEKVKKQHQEIRRKAIQKGSLIEIAKSEATLDENNPDELAT